MGFREQFLRESEAVEGRDYFRARGIKDVGFNLNVNLMFSRPPRDDDEKEARVAALREVTQQICIELAPTIGRMVAERLVQQYPQLTLSQAEWDALQETRGRA